MHAQGRAIMGPIKKQLYGGLSLDDMTSFSRVFMFSLTRYHVRLGQRIVTQLCGVTVMWKKSMRA